MKYKQTTVYIQFRDSIDIDALEEAFPEDARYQPLFGSSCLISSYLTFKSILDLMEHYFPQQEYFICVASKYYHVKPAS